LLPDVVMRPSSSSRWLAALTVGAFAEIGVACSSGSPAGDAGELDSDPQALSAARQISGSYEGRGEIVALTLEQTPDHGTVKNTFKATRVVQCVRAPCPEQPLEGRWFARSPTLKLYAAGTTLSYRYSLDDGKLVLKDAAGHVLSELDKRPPVSAGITDALARHGVSRMKVTIPADEIAKQTRYGGSVDFDKAIDEALTDFLENDSDPESPLGLIDQLEDDDACKKSTAKASVKCLLDSPDAELTLVTESTAADLPETIDVRKNWVLSLYLQNFTDHGHWAVVDRSGHEPTYDFNFN
jgi:hypothetical protein